MATIYGIKNCDTMKRAFAWLQRHEVAYEFHDYKKVGISEETLQLWSDQIGWEKLLNTRGTTWRKLTEDQRADMNKDKAVQLMINHPSLIKRPVIAHGKMLLVGYDESDYERVLRKFV